jgi:hypothetical protein
MTVARVDPAQPERVLALARELLDALPRITLDIVDGEFFWRVCHAELAEAFPCREEALFPPVYMHGPDAWPRFTTAHDTWNAGMAAVRTALGDAFFRIPPAIQDALLSGSWVSMRPALVRVALHSAHFGRDEVLVAEIRSGAWDGATVEEAMMHGWYREMQSWPDLLHSHWERMKQAKGETCHLALSRIACELVGDLECATDDCPFWGPGDLPYVAVHVPFPLPPAGVMAHTYDAIVRDAHAWHLELPGGVPSRQERIVAIRTWAIALLMAHGMRFGAAQHVLGQHCGLPDISQSRFSEDRRRLLQRVPEAQPYLQPLR